jgi:hypothetical protein
MLSLPFLLSIMWCANTNHATRYSQTKQTLQGPAKYSSNSPEPLGLSMRSVKIQCRHDALITFNHVSLCAFIAIQFNYYLLGRFSQYF